MMRLGSDPTILARYREIKIEDLKPLKSCLEDNSQGVGQGYKAILWIWCNYNSLKIDEWQIDGMYLNLVYKSSC
jgi:hypothetical protein